MIKSGKQTPSNKQVAVSDSSAEVKLCVMALVTAEITWLLWLLEEFGVSVSMLTHFCLIVQGLLVLLVIR
jgi:hypothetical protein